MKDTYFITGNLGKLQELQAVIPNIKGLDIDVPEIQELSAKLIIKAKLEEALKTQRGAFIVEDTSLYFDSFNGLPGPLIKWFLKSIGNEGLHNLAMSSKNTGASAKVIIGYTDGSGDIQYFEGQLKGQIVAPAGDNGFGWDAIFQPDGHDKTFAQMTNVEKNQISMRKVAALQLKDYLSK